MPEAHPQSESSQPTPDPPSLRKLREMLKSRSVVQRILDKGADEFEVIDLSSWPGPKPTPGWTWAMRPSGLKALDEIRVYSKNLVYYTWHLRDYIQLIAEEERGLSEGAASKLINEWVRTHRTLAILSYLAVAEKHATVRRKNPADDIMPKYGNVCIILPVINGMKLLLYPSEQIEIDLDNILATLSGDPAVQTVVVLDKDDKELGLVQDLVDEGARAWLELLESKLGVKAPPVATPVDRQAKSKPHKQVHQLLSRVGRANGPTEK